MPRNWWGRRAALYPSPRWWRCRRVVLREHPATPRNPVSTGVGPSVEAGWAPAGPSAARTASNPTVASTGAELRHSFSHPSSTAPTSRQTAHARDIGRIIGGASRCVKPTCLVVPGNTPACLAGRPPGLEGKPGMSNTATPEWPSLRKRRCWLLSPHRTQVGRMRCRPHEARARGRTDEPGPGHWPAPPRRGNRGAAATRPPSGARVAPWWRRTPGRSVRAIGPRRPGRAAETGAGPLLGGADRQRAADHDRKRRQHHPSQTESPTACKRTSAHATPGPRGAGR